MFDPYFFEYILIVIPVILISITIHEYAHGKVADMLGDSTARLAGRLTLNPISHIDPIGFIALILVRFGWAKPVPINPYNFRDPKSGMLYVSLAGPLSNFTFAWLLSLALKFIPLVPLWISILQYAIWLNLALAIFNLIPIPPLDGAKILAGILPYRSALFINQLEHYGFLLLVLFMVFPATSYLLVTAVTFLFKILTL